MEKLNSKKAGHFFLIRTIFYELVVLGHNDQFWFHWNSKPKHKNPMSTMPILRPWKLNF